MVPFAFVSRMIDELPRLREGFQYYDLPLPMPGPEARLRQRLALLVGRYGLPYCPASSSRTRTSRSFVAWMPSISGRKEPSYSMPT